MSDRSYSEKSTAYTTGDSLPVVISCNSLTFFPGCIIADRCILIMRCLSYVGYSCFYFTAAAAYIIKVRTHVKYHTHTHT